LCGSTDFQSVLDCAPCHVDRHLLGADTATIPHRLTLRDIGRATLHGVSVTAGVTTFVIFPLVLPGQAGRTRPARPRSTRSQGWRWTASSWG